MNVKVPFDIPYYLYDGDMRTDISNSNAFELHRRFVVIVTLSITSVNLPGKKMQRTDTRWTHRNEWSRTINNRRKQSPLGDCGRANNGGKTGNRETIGGKRTPQGRRSLITNIEGYFLRFADPADVWLGGNEEDSLSGAICRGYIVYRNGGSICTRISSTMAAISAIGLSIMILQ